MLIRCHKKISIPGNNKNRRRKDAVPNSNQSTTIYKSLYPATTKKMQSLALCFSRVTCSILSKQSITKYLRSQPMSSSLNGTFASNNNGKQCEVIIQKPPSACITTYQSKEQQNSKVSFVFGINCFCVFRYLACRKILVNEKLQQIDKNTLHHFFLINRKQLHFQKT